MMFQQYFNPDPQNSHACHPAYPFVGVKTRKEYVSQAHKGQRWTSNIKHQRFILGCTRFMRNLNWHFYDILQILKTHMPEDGMFQGYTLLSIMRCIQLL